MIAAVSTPEATILRRVRNYFKPVPRKWSSTYFINMCSAIAIGFMLLFGWLEANWHFNVAPQAVKCLPYDYFVVRQSPPKELVKGNIYAYGSKGLEPLLPDGVNMAKILAAKAGDRVVVDASGVYINGKLWGPLNVEVLAKSGRTAASVSADYIVPEGKLLMLGTLPRSYDGRYWGLIDVASVRGRAYPLW